MPTNQPSNAPDEIEPRDRDTAAGVLSDGATDEAPGGGALIGEGQGGDAVPAGGASPNSPVETGVDAGDAGAVAEARNRAAADTAEPGQTSQ